MYAAGDARSLLSPPRLPSAVHLQRGADVWTTPDWDQQGCLGRPAGRRSARKCRSSWLDLVLEWREYLTNICNSVCYNQKMFKKKKQFVPKPTQTFCCCCCCCCCFWRIQSLLSLSTSTVRPRSFIEPLRSASLYCRRSVITSVFIAGRLMSDDGSWLIDMNPVASCYPQFFTLFSPSLISLEYG